jgi:hypothetical protein
VWTSIAVVQYERRRAACDLCYPLIYCRFEENGLCALGNVRSCDEFSWSRALKILKAVEACKKLMVLLLLLR